MFTTIYKWIKNNTSLIFLSLGQLFVLGLILYGVYYVTTTVIAFKGFRFDPILIVAVLVAGWYVGSRLTKVSESLDSIKDVLFALNAEVVEKENTKKEVPIPQIVTRPKTITKTKRTTATKRTRKTNPKKTRKSVKKTGS